MFDGEDQQRGTWWRHWLRTGMKRCFPNREHAARLTDSQVEDSPMRSTLRRRIQLRNLHAVNNARGVMAEGARAVGARIQSASVQRVQGVLCGAVSVPYARVQLVKRQYRVHGVG